MRIDIITCLPRILDGFFDHSIVKRAQEKGLAEVHVHDLRDYAFNKHKQVDDYQYGGGAGMVLMVEPITMCIEGLKAVRKYDEVVYLSPDGASFTQMIANEFTQMENVILLCGHYKGIDERVREHLITREISIGDYVLSGGELAAAVVSDAIIRLLPGVLTDETSALSDSFQDHLLAAPVYTRPADYKGWKVPDILLSGHAAKIEEWRYARSLERTETRRPDLLSDPGADSNVST